MKRSVPLLVLGLTAAAATTLAAQDMQKMHMDSKQAMPSSAANSSTDSFSLPFHSERPHVKAPPSSTGIVTTTPLGHEAEFSKVAVGV